MRAIWGLCLHVELWAWTMSAAAGRQREITAEASGMGDELVQHNLP